jgi:uncharacterized protein (DUF488 family)
MTARRTTRGSSRDRVARSSRAIFTVGYGGRTPEGLLELLRDHKIDTVCDVRFRPRSRWMLWANYYTLRGDGPLRQMIERAGFEYRWLGRALGNPRPKEQNLAAFKRLMDQEGEERVAELMGLARSRRVCLLCAARDPRRCHRSVISRFLEGRGFDYADL